MGMFDEVTIAAPHNEAIDERLRNEKFQTKDFECMMWQYTITADGRLMEYRTHLEPLPDEECEYYGTPEWERGGMYRLFGSMRTIDDGVVDLDYHGDIRFYTSIGRQNDGDYEWIEYKARFTDGKLSWIKRVEES